MNYNTLHLSWLLFGTFIVCLVAFHLLFVWPRNLSQRKWKYLDYAVILVTLISLVSGSADIRRRIATRSIDSLRERTAAMHRLFCSFYVDTPPSYICMKFTRTEFSPPNLDEMQREYDSMGDWLKVFATSFSAATLPDFRTVEWKQFKAPEVQDKVLNDFLASMQKQLSYYNEAAGALAQAQADTQETSMETVVFFLWPFLLVATLALGMAKASGELRHKC